MDSIRGQEGRMDRKGKGWDPSGPFGSMETEWIILLTAVPLALDGRKLSSSE